MRQSIERALWAAIIVGAIWLLMAEGAAYASPPPRHAVQAQGNRAELRNQLLRPHLRVVILP